MSINETIPIINPQSNYILTDNISFEEIYPAVYCRKRFNNLTDLLMKIEKIDAGDFSDMISNRYFIFARQINDARLAAMAIFFKLQEKGIDYGRSILLEDESECSFGSTPMSGSPFQTMNINLQEGTISADTDNAVMIITDNGVFDWDEERDGMCDERLKFFVFCSQSAGIKEISEVSARMSISCLNIIIEDDSTEDICAIINDIFDQNDYDTCLVEKEIRMLSEYIPNDNEYSAIQICRKLISDHLMEDPDDRTLRKKPFTDMIKALKEKRRCERIHKPVLCADQELVGLDKEMSAIDGVVRMLTMAKWRRELNEDTRFQGFNMIFAGPPGTAKTTIARRFAHDLERLGFINSADHFKECVKSDIVGQYVGQTAKRVDELFSVMAAQGGGVIFFDEIYTLSEHDSSSYDKEAVTCITQNMENYRDRIFCIFAGYEDKMSGFIESNPGLSSRIHKTVRFNEYDNDTLCSIFRSIVKGDSCTLAEDCDDILKEHFTKLKKLRGERFGNGREARNLYSNALQQLAMRIVDGKRPSKKKLSTLTREDISAASEEILSSELERDEIASVRRIGF
ncbi:MAG: AAA family ATPase [Oscillospiraceae bacterium]|nr:AAA family ATPase [Oscillospiraceae bacterium]